jgi:hypothetical protein
MGGRKQASLALVTVIVAVVLVAVATRGGDEERGAHREAQQRPATSYRDPALRFRVEIPEGWRRARDIVIPQVTNPREILVVSTFALDSAVKPCGPFYDHLLGHMGRREGLVAVQERSGHSVAGPPKFRPRPKRFRLPIRAPERRGCGRNRDRRLVRDWWVPFRDAGRDFYAQVAIGSAAPDEVRRDAMQLLDSLRFKRRDGSGG